MGYNYTAYMDYMVLTVSCPRKAVKLTHSLTHRGHVFRKKKQKKQWVPYVFEKL